jgi:heme A synthase
LFEALLGAGLVLFGLVEDNSSNLRIVAVSIHLLNTFILLGLVATNAWWSNHPLLSSFGINRVKKLFYGFLMIIAMIGVTGAITALADTLFPSTSMMHTLSEQFQKNNHILISLRILHPILAILLGFAISFILINYLETDNATINKLKVGLWILILLQFGLGFSNIIFLTPVSIQVIHLVIADIIWILTVFLFLSEPIIRIKNHE